MRKRDLAILMLSAFTIFFSLQPHPRRVDEGFSEARVLAEVSPLPDKIRVASGWRAVAMAAGVMDNTQKRGQPLKQVLVVVLRMYLDPFEEIGIAERNAEQHRRSANEKETSVNSGIVNLRHFAFYALLVELVSSVGVERMREFGQAILRVMPHHRDRREDTRLQLSHFRPHKRKGLKKVPRKTTNYPFHKPEENHPPGKDSSNKISNIIGKAANYAASAKSKKVRPDADCISITLYSNHNKLHPAWWVPNVVVAHQKEGIEAVHLASGRTLCKLHLREGGLHADINGDGVLDHVQAVEGNEAELLREMERSRLLLVDQWKCCDLVGRLQLLLYQGSNTYSHPKKGGHRHRKGRCDVVSLTNRGSRRSEAVVISPGGSIQTLIDLPATPTHALISEDFSNDGLTDLIVVTSNGVYGFVQTRTPGALFFSTLVGCLLIVMASSW
ncbi:hypothetical protein GH714_034340 [Hevea brasiliensis]|uniref:Uncharacterized protein n=1 Tax=Hevea brasiliensis TaxID=3981 RepID=A0A6A6MIL6_HEVBR|nr:hypothetical protein GH714_034340 [Hevea brasiliensis]